MPTHFMNQSQGFGGPPPPPPAQVLSSGPATNQPAVGGGRDNLLQDIRDIGTSKLKVCQIICLRLSLLLLLHFSNDQNDHHYQKLHHQVIQVLEYTIQWHRIFLKFLLTDEIKLVNSSDFSKHKFMNLFLFLF
jgi:hypothetical protein